MLAKKLENILWAKAEILNFPSLETRYVNKKKLSYWSEGVIGSYFF